MTVVEETADEIRVDLPTSESTGECYHAPGAPCGSHITETHWTTPEYLRDSTDLTACSGCVEYHGLEDYDAE